MPKRVKGDYVSARVAILRADWDPEVFGSEVSFWGRSDEQIFQVDGNTVEDGALDAFAVDAMRSEESTHLVITDAIRGLSTAEFGPIYDAQDEIKTWISSAIAHHGLSPDLSDDIAWLILNNGSSDMEDGEWADIVDADWVGSVGEGDQLHIGEASWAGAAFLDAVSATGVEAIFSEDVGFDFGSLDLTEHWSESSRFVALGRSNESLVYTSETSDVELPLDVSGGGLGGSESAASLLGELVLFARKHGRRERGTERGLTNQWFCQLDPIVRVVFDGYADSDRAQDTEKFKCIFDFDDLNGAMIFTVEVEARLSGDPQIDASLAEDRFREEIEAQAKNVGIDADEAERIIRGTAFNLLENLGGEEASETIAQDAGSFAPQHKPTVQRAPGGHEGRVGSGRGRIPHVECSLCINGINIPLGFSALESIIAQMDSSEFEVVADVLASHPHQSVRQMAVGCELSEEALLNVMRQEKDHRVLAALIGSTNAHKLTHNFLVSMIKYPQLAEAIANGFDGLTHESVDRLILLDLLVNHPEPNVRRSSLWHASGSRLRALASDKDPAIAKEARERMLNDEDSDDDLSALEATERNRGHKLKLYATVKVAFKKSDVSPADGNFYIKSIKCEDDARKTLSRFGDGAMFEFGDETVVLADLWEEGVRFSWRKYEHGANHWLVEVKGELIVEPFNSPEAGAARAPEGWRPKEGRMTLFELEFRRDGDSPPETLTTSDLIGGVVESVHQVVKNADHEWVELDSDG